MTLGVPLRYSRCRLAASGDELHRPGAVPGLFCTWATTQRLVLAQQAVDAKENEWGAIPRGVRPTGAQRRRGDHRRRHYLCSAALTPARLAEAVRGHWGIENSRHWVARRHLQGRPVPPSPRPCCSQHGGRPPLRHQPCPPRKGRPHDKTMRKVAGWKPDELNRVLSPNPR